MQSGTNSSLQIKMDIWRPFFEFELAGSGVGARCRLKLLFGELQINKKSAPNGHYFLQRAATP
jgi:hypothetical protein